MARLFTRSLYQQIESRITWHEPVQLSSEAKSELNFWLKNLNKVNGYSIKPNPAVTKIMFTDASDTGYGGFTFVKLEKVLCSGRLTYQESLTSSTARELLAVKYALISFGDILSGESVQVNIDNINASRILSIGSSKQHLHVIAVDVFLHCLKHNIKLIPKWIPRDMNKEADDLSRVRDTDNWSIDQCSYEKINYMHGPFTYDRFADDLNCKTLKFNSKYHCPGTSGVNAFTFNWKNENNWLCPPINLIGSCIRHLKICKGKGTLLIPIWESAYFWPLIYPEGKTLAFFIKHFMVIKPTFQSPITDNVFGQGKSFDCLALKIEFNE